MGLAKWLKISPEKIMDRVKQYNRFRELPEVKSKVNKPQSLNIGTINNIVIFIRFSDESEYTDATSTYNSLFNDDGVNSLKSYYLEASYSDLTVNTTFYPPSGGTVVSYQDSHQRAYYKPYNPVTNTIGYQNSSQSTTREHTLLMNAVNAVSSSIPPSLNIDANGDGMVDNVCFIIYGSPGAWSDLLWPHMWTLYSYNVYINGKRVWRYNFQLQTWMQAGVLCHEMFHTLGAPDMYHYNDNLTPIGPWDLMANTTNPPQHMGAYMKWRYGLWINSIPEISNPGYYTLNSLIYPTNNCYKVKSANSTSEYYVLEYRSKSGIFESSVPGSGLLVYRINTSANGQGNANYPSPPDEGYIYRPGGTTVNDGNYNSAFFSATSGRIELNDATDPSGFLSSGLPGGLTISEVGTPGSTITFRLGAGPSPPNLKSPLDGALDVQTSPTLIWYSSSDAVSYQVQVSTQSDFSTVYYSQQNITDTNIVVNPPLLANLLYYWRVKKITSSSSSDWSAAWSFTTILAPPTLVSPTNNSTGVPVNATLKWNTVSSALGYNLQIAKDSNFTNIVLRDSGMTSVTYLCSGLNNSTKYYWHVAAVGTNGVSDWSGFWNFTTALGPPTIPNPPTNATGIPLSGKLSWNKIALADSYRLQVSHTWDFAATIVNIANIPDSTYQYSGLDYATKYYWRVASNKSPETSPWSTTWNFFTILTTPILNSPSNNAIGLPDSNSTLTWGPVQLADSYILQISTKSNFSDFTLNDSTYNDNNYKYINLKNITKYFWRVKARNKDGDTSNWSEVRNFSTIPESPVLVFPANNSTAVNPSGSFKWNTVKGVTSYGLMVSIDSNFTSTDINATNLTNSSYSFSNLINNTKYYWQVNATGLTGTSNWSQSKVFKTALSPPVLIYPTNNSTEAQTSDTFTWNKVTGSSKYHILVSQTNDFLNPVINDSNITSNNYSYSDLDNNIKYYWKVNGSNTEGQGEWSQSWNFTTSLYAKPILKTPANNDFWSPVSGRLTWKAIKNAVSYTLRVSANPDFSSPVILDSGITNNYYDYTGLQNNIIYYWQVLAKILNSTTDWSDRWNFLTMLQSPELTTPKDNAIKVQLHGYLNWKAVPGADSYRIQLSKDSNFTTIISDSANISDNKFPYDSLVLSTIYYWHVNAKNNKGTTLWSALRKFTTDFFISVNDRSDNLLKISIYPNPFSSIVNIDYTIPENSNFSLLVYNTIGEQVASIFYGYLDEGNYHIKWDRGNLPSGIYYLRLSSSTESKLVSIIIID
jgi:M6 family metalloprotease-like protein